MSGKVYLVDGSGYIFRAFYAVAPLSTREGFPTNALFGFVRMLLKLLNASDSQHVAIAFDVGRETFRTEMYREYKANRIECPEDLKKQMPFFRDISAALGLAVLEKPGFEADDIIGTVARRLAENGHEVVIVSGDKDLMQLVGPHVSIWDTMHDRRFQAAQVQEKFGVGPEKVTEILGLMGDSSDNVPGLNGVGPKTALALVQKYGSIENIIASVEMIRNDSELRNRKKIADQIQTDADLLRLCRKLVEIECQVPFEFNSRGIKSSVLEMSAEDLYQALERSVPDENKLHALVERFEFSSLLRDLKLSPKPAEPPSGADYRAIFADEFDSFCGMLSRCPAFAFDIETTSLSVQDAQVVGLSFCAEPGKAFYLPVGHLVTPEGKRQVSFSQVRECLGPILADPKIRKAGQNIKFDISVLAEQGIEVKGVWFDTMLASYLLNPDKGSHNLTVLANEFLQLPVQEFDEVLGDSPDFTHVAVEHATRYACQDAHYVWLLQQLMLPKLQEQDLVKVFNEIEMPLVPVLSRMERSGVKLDAEVLSSMSKEFAIALEKMQAELFALAGGEFNINSPKQLTYILFNKLGLPTKGVRKTKTGLSTDSAVLEKLSPLHPLPALVLRYRMVYKLKSTYVDTLQEQICAKTKRLHSRFNQAVTGTGRLSSSDPNLQNIPIQTEEGRRIRCAFVAEPGNSLISADYSQIELRVLAHLSADEGLIAAFAAGQDIHAKTAKEILGLAQNEEITSEQRRIGKTINFGIIYGMGPFRLARDLGISMVMAQDYIENYFNRFPRVKDYFSNLEHEVEDKGFVTTLYGRKRFTSSIDSADRDKGFVIRAAMNAPLQGTAADLMKLAMIRIDRRIQAEEMPIKMILQIHDELVFECPDSFLTAGATFVRQEMENVADFMVPLRVDVGTGKDWNAAHA